MVRKCSQCGHNGHNSRTCISTRDLAGGSGVRLFGVQLHMASPLKKSFGMECLSYTYLASSSSSRSSSSSSSSSSPLASVDEATEKIFNGSLSDGLGGRTQERKKGVPWNEEEHRSFLAGLEKLGKGDWRGISRHFVNTRTPTQVASHAQKYFLRLNRLTKKKRRHSLFDVTNCEGATHNTGSFKSEDHCLSTALHAPIPSLNIAGQKTSETATIDLNSSSQEQETQLLDLIPWSSTSVERTPAQFSHLDLDLSISTSRLIQNNPSPDSLCFGTIRVI